MADILGFKEPHRFLSNFAPSPIEYDGHKYPTGEHLYQALKSLVPGERALVRAAPSPREAKRLGRVIAKRKGWGDIQVEVMRTVLRLKFEQNGALARKLVATAPAKIVEVNAWGDRFWGVSESDGQGENTLGKLLMCVRDDLMGVERPTHWVSIVRLEDGTGETACLLQLTLQGDRWFDENNRELKTATHGKSVTCSECIKRSDKEIAEKNSKAHWTLNPLI